MPAAIRAAPAGPSVHMSLPPLQPDQLVKPSRFELRISLIFAAVFIPLGVNVPYFPLWLEAKGFGPEEIAVIKEQVSESEDTERPKVHFDVGETIKINDGPFLNFSGVIEEIEPDRGKLKVTVNIFGRNTPVELEYWQVEKA